MNKHKPHEHLPEATQEGLDPRAITRFASSGG